MKNPLIMLHYIDRIWVSRFNIESGVIFARVTLLFNFKGEAECWFLSLFESGACLNHETQIIKTIRIGHFEFLHQKRKKEEKRSFLLLHFLAAV